MAVTVKWKTLTTTGSSITPETPPPRPVIKVACVNWSGHDFHQTVVYDSSLPSVQGYNYNNSGVSVDHSVDVWAQKENENWELVSLTWEAISLSKNFKQGTYPAGTDPAYEKVCFARLGIDSEVSGTLEFTILYRPKATYQINFALNSPIAQPPEDSAEIGNPEIIPSLTQTVALGSTEGNSGKVATLDTGDSSGDSSGSSSDDSSDDEPKETYFFTGFFTAPEGGTQVYDISGNAIPGTEYWDAESRWNYAGDLWLYAHWQSSNGNRLVQISFDPNYDSKPANTTPALAGLPIALPYLERDGYYLKGWYTAAEGGNLVGVAGASYSPSADTTLYAQWQAESEGVPDGLTVAGLRADIGVLPGLFAPSASDRCEVPDLGDGEDEEFNIRTGFPESFAKPLASGGRVVTRQMLNAIGNLGTQLQFFEQCGGYHTFDPAFAAAVGGYPKDAVLRFYDEETNTLRTVRSLKDDNMDNFLEDRSFIGSLIYTPKGRVSWAYADDNPSVGVKVDYSDFTDISDSLFVETGVPDLYEVPYDSFLQLFAVVSLSAESILRPVSEDVSALVSYTISRGQTVPVYEDVNAAYYCKGRGSVHIDIYHKSTSSFASAPIGYLRPTCWFDRHIATDGQGANWLGTNGHWEIDTPLSPVSGGFLLSKGDKIRIRNTVTTEVMSGLYGPPKTESQGIHPMEFADDKLRRVFSAKSASLFRRGVTA